jgi:hypothetical protein
MLIHRYITEQSVHDKSLLRTHHQLFLGIGDPRFLPVHQLLGLDRNEILDGILSELFFLRRFIVRRKLRARRSGSRPEQGEIIIQEERETSGKGEEGGAPAHGQKGKSREHPRTGDSRRGSPPRASRSYRESAGKQRDRGDTKKQKKDLSSKAPIKPDQVNEAFERFKDALTKKDKNGS